MKDTTTEHSERCQAVGAPVEQPVRPTPKRGTADRAEWLADKLHNGGDYGKEAAALLVHQAKELDYLRAGREDRKPAWAPPGAVLALKAAVLELERLRDTLAYAEAALADIGDADREPGDDLAWCEARAAEALPRVREHLAALGPNAMVSGRPEA